MPKRKIDPTTGEPQLTYREQLLVDEFIRNGGNGAQAAASAGYTAARLDQAAYQVLHRERVQQHIRERIRDSRVSADEIIGTLASHMRGDLTEFFDESGNFSIEIARKKGIGHLLKSISGTICNPEHPDPNIPQPANPSTGKPANAPRPQRPNVQTCKRCNAPRAFRAQLHSPLQAASILARLIGPDRHRRQPSTFNLQRSTNHDFDPNALLQSLIEEQMKEHGLSRDAVTNRILHVRPEFAKYLDRLPTPPGPLDDLSFRDTAKLLNVVLDTIASLRQAPSPSDTSDRVVDGDSDPESSGCEPAVHDCQPDRRGQTLPKAAGVNPQCVTAGITEGDLKLPYNPAIIDDAITDYLDQPTIDNEMSDLDQTRPETDHSPAKTELAVQAQTQPAAHVPSSNLQLSTFNPQPIPDPAELQAFNRKYSTINRPLKYGQLNNCFTEVIHEIMKDQSLTPQQAIDSIWREARQDTWFSAELIDRCIADYAALHPRLAHSQPPVSTGRPPSSPRYCRPVSPETSNSPNACLANITDDDSTILTSTQLFSPAIRPPPVPPHRDG